MDRPQESSKSYAVAPQDGLTVGFEVEAHALDPRTLSESGDIAARAIECGDAIEEFHRSVIEQTTDVFSPMNIRETLGNLRLQEIAAMHKAGGHTLHYSVSLDGDGDFAVAGSSRYAPNDTRDHSITGYAINSGIHVHVGVNDPELRIEVANRFNEFSHLLVMLAGSSPINAGFRRTYGSFRVHDFGAMASIYDKRFESYSDYLSFATETLASLNRTDVTTLHPWIRPVLDYNPLTKLLVAKPRTVEVRLFDNGLTVDDQVFTVMMTVGLINAIIDDIENGRPARTFVDSGLWRSLRERSAVQGVERPTRNPFVAVTDELSQPAVGDPWDVAEALFNEVRRGLEVAERKCNAEPGTLTREFNAFALALREKGTGAQRLLAAHDALCADLKNAGLPVADTEAWYAGRVPMTRETATALKVWLLCQNHFGGLLDKPVREDLSIESIYKTDNLEFAAAVGELRANLFGFWCEKLFDSGVRVFGPQVSPKSFEPDDVVKEDFRAS